MIVDFGEVSFEVFEDVDVVIVGLGFVGVIFVWEFSGSGLRVCVFESGFFVFIFYVDGFCYVQSEGIQIKVYLRECVLGGVLMIWVGFFSFLDVIEFEFCSYFVQLGWFIEWMEFMFFYVEVVVCYCFFVLEFYEVGGFDVYWVVGEF